MKIDNEKQREILLLAIENLPMKGSYLKMKEGIRDIEPVEKAVIDAVVAVVEEYE